MRAVIKESDCNAASNTKVPRPSAAMSRLRLGKLAAKGGCAQRVLAEQDALMGNVCSQYLVLRRINPVQAGAHHRHGASGR